MLYPLSYGGTGAHLQFYRFRLRFDGQADGQGVSRIGGRGWRESRCSGVVANYSAPDRDLRVGLLSLKCRPSAAL